MIRENKDDRNPSSVDNIYWIIAFNRIGNYNIKSGESGKWLLFDHKSKTDDLWCKIREATRSGLLGHSSKISTFKINPNATDNDFKVICIYSSDYQNEADLNRIVNEIRNLGINNKLIYKLDSDVGKYQVNGHKNLAKKVDLSDKYKEVLDWMKLGSNNQYVKYLGFKNGKDRFRFRRGKMKIDIYQEKRLNLIRLGFVLDKKSEIINEEFYFTSC